MVPSETRNLFKILGTKNSLEHKIDKSITQLNNNSVFVQCLLFTVLALAEINTPMKLTYEIQISIDGNIC